MELLFWLCTLTICYVYMGYPLILILIARVRKVWPILLESPSPTVSLIISARNEAEVIREKLENALNLDYPADLLDIVVISDCSDDGTDEIVASVGDPRIRLLRMTEQVGKSAGLNMAAAASTAEVLVFTDANAMFERDALKHLTRHFADPRIGVVTGEQRYLAADGHPDQESLYWKYELALKKLESGAGSVVGGDGAIMALRRHLFTPLEPSDLSDYLLPLRIVMSGYRNVYESEALCYEKPTADNGKEFRRKVRIVNRAWRATMKVKAVLNPLRYGWFSLQIWSHKVLRWLVTVFMAGALLSSALLIQQGLIFAVALAAQVVFYAPALIGALARGRGMPGWVLTPYYFCLVNYASLKGIFDNYRGKTYTTWTTVRESGPQPN